MRKTKIAVFVSGGGTNLQALIDAADAGKLPSGEIVLVLASSPKAFALERAAKAGIPSAVVSAKTEGSQAAAEEKMNQLLAEYGVELIVLAGYLSILSEDFTRRWEKVTGATVHFVNEIPDGGEILLQQAVEVLPGDTPETLQRRVMEQAEWKLLPRAAELVSKQLLEEHTHVENV